MPTTLYAHLTWTTFRRKPLIDGGVAIFLRKFLPATARRCGADLLAVGIVNDHVHALLLLPSQIDVPKLVQALKGASARVANRDGIVTGEKLRWANGYDLRSVSPQALDRARAYVESQEAKHPLDRVTD